MREADASKQAEPKPEEPGKRMTVMTIKGTAEWKAWLDRLSDYSRLPSTILIDVALADWAKRNGFEEPPPKRQIR